MNGLQMKWHRFTVAGLMVIVLLIAMGLAALRSQSIVWTSAVFTAAIILFSTSVVGAISTGGLARSTWAGMAVFGWTYYGIVFGPWPDSTSKPPPLLTANALDYVQDYILSDGETPYMFTMKFPAGGQSAHGIRGRMVPGAAPPPGGYKKVDLGLYQQTGHSLAGILFGVLGALMGRFIAALSERAEAT